VLVIVVMFNAAGDYDRFMGRYSTLLAPQMADLANVKAGQRVLDVGCGPGALTGELVRRVGAANVTAIDPSEPFVAAIRERYAGVDARVGPAEALPFPDHTFDATLAQLVVHFMRDPLAGLREMKRVTKPGGAVVVCVWDHAGDKGPLSPFWRAAREIGLKVEDESNRAGAREGHLVRLMTDAGLRDVRGTTVTSRITHPTFEAYWEPFELSVGPAGVMVAGLDTETRLRLREHLRAAIPARDFHQDAVAWAARGTV